jgi:uncharacterized membrane protein YphA (DoxX/SURF4 family)
MTNITSKLPSVARVVLGLSFFVFGLNGFMHFIPQPAPPPAAAAFAGALFASGYFFPLLKGIEVLASLLLLGNRYVPLALAVLAPVIINIVAFHLFLEPPATLVLPLVLLALELYLARSYREAFSSMLQARTTPHAAPPASGRARVPAHAG